MDGVATIVEGFNGTEEKEKRKEKKKRKRRRKSSRENIESEHRNKQVRTGG